MAFPIDNPGVYLVLGIISRATRDWHCYRLRLWADVPERARKRAARAAIIVPHREEMQEFFFSRAFDGLCEWAGLDAAQVREANGVNRLDLVIIECPHCGNVIRQSLAYTHILFECAVCGRRYKLVKDGNDFKAQSVEYYGVEKKGAG